MENIFLIDWLGFTCKTFVNENEVYTVSDIIDLLGLGDFTVRWENIYGMHGYKDRLYFDGISIHYNGTSSTIWVEMSGAGCRTFETISKIDFCGLFNILNSRKDIFHITRLDIAFDEFSGLLQREKLEQETTAGNFVSRFRDIRLEKSFTSEAFTFYYGSMKSDIMFRIYNKAVERNKQQLIPHWIRFEQQLRDERAANFIECLCYGETIGSAFFGVVNAYLKYLTPNPNNEQKSRWRVAPWWLELLQNSDIIKLTKCDKEYNELNLHNFVINQAGGAIRTFDILYGDGAIQKALKENIKPLNSKYQKLIEESRYKNGKTIQSHDANETITA